MLDRKKVLRGLECHLKELSVGKTCYECPYIGDNPCEIQLIANVLELLKEHEPILLENQHKPYGHIINANSPWISRCPKCSKKIEGKQTRFCKYCGQSVKWED